MDEKSVVRGSSVRVQKRDPQLLANQAVYRLRLRIYFFWKVTADQQENKSKRGPALVFT